MIVIRKAKQADIDNICKVWCEFLDFHKQFDPAYERAKNGHKAFADFLSKQISSKTALVLVATDRNQICGYIQAKTELKPPVFKARKHGAIYDLAVVGNKRRKGIGTKLYQTATKWFKSKRVDRIELTVATTNPISNAFWRKMGFEPYYTRMFKKITMIGTQP